MQYNSTDGNISEQDMGERENEEKERDGGEQRKREEGSKGGAEKEFFTANTTWGAQLPRG